MTVCNNEYMSSHSLLNLLILGFKRLINFNRMLTGQDFDVFFACIF